MEKLAVRARVVGVNIGADGSLVTLAVGPSDLEELHRMFGAEIILQVTTSKDRLCVVSIVTWKNGNVKVVGGPVLVSSELRWQIVDREGGTHWVRDSDLENHRVRP